ncbi:MAG TPA: GGDEF domain-containing protein [Paraburkholderia sp.]
MRINDTSGHDVGDQVLLAVAAIIHQHAQTYPHGRLGGEEFGVVFAGEERDARDFAKALCEGVANLRLATHAVTISIGVSTFDKALSVADIFRMADQGLYEVKRQGKNNFVLVS